MSTGLYQPAPTTAAPAAQSKQELSVRSAASSQQLGDSINNLSQCSTATGDAPPSPVAKEKSQQNGMMSGLFQTLLSMGLQEYEAVLKVEGISEPKDLANIATPDDLPSCLPIGVRLRLAAHARNVSREREQQNRQTPAAETLQPRKRGAKDKPEGLSPLKLPGSADGKADAKPGGKRVRKRRGSGPSGSGRGSPPREGVAVLEPTTKRNEAMIAAGKSAAANLLGRRGKPQKTMPLTHPAALLARDWSPVAAAADRTPPSSPSSSSVRQGAGLAAERGGRPEAASGAKGAENVTKLRDSLLRFYDEPLDRPKVSAPPRDAWPAFRTELLRVSQDIQHRCGKQREGAAGPVTAQGKGPDGKLYSDEEWEQAWWSAYTNRQWVPAETSSRPAAPSMECPPSSINLLDWLEGMPHQWQMAFPEQENPFLLHDVLDPTLRGLGKSYPLPYLNNECCFEDGDGKPKEIPQCRVCGAVKWQARISGTMETCRSICTRCIEQIDAVASTEEWTLHSESPCSWMPAFHYDRLATLQWQRSVLAMQPLDATQGIIAVFIYTFDIRKPHKKLCAGNTRRGASAHARTCVTSATAPPPASARCTPRR